MECLWKPPENLSHSKCTRKNSTTPNSEFSQRGSVRRLGQQQPLPQNAGRQGGFNQSASPPPFRIPQERRHIKRQRGVEVWEASQPLWNINLLWVNNWLCVADRCTAAGVNPLTLQTRNGSSSGSVGKITNYLFSSSSLLCSLPLSLSLSSFLYLSPSLSHTHLLSWKQILSHTFWPGKEVENPYWFHFPKDTPTDWEGEQKRLCQICIAEENREGYTVTQPANLVRPQEARADLYDLWPLVHTCLRFWFLGEKTSSCDLTISLLPTLRSHWVRLSSQLLSPLLLVLLQLSSLHNYSTLFMMPRFSVSYSTFCLLLGSNTTCFFSPGLCSVFWAHLSLSGSSDWPVSLPGADQRLAPTLHKGSCTNSWVQRDYMAEAERSGEQDQLDNLLNTAWH